MAGATDEPPADDAGADTALPAPVLPMKAVSGELPTDAGWAFEVKWDGMRIVALVGDRRVRLLTANGLDATARFPELQGLVAPLAGHTAILDGEIVALDADGRPSFSLLQRRMHRSAPDDPARADVTIRYHVFDLLRLDGHETVAVPYEDRRRLLEELLEAGPHWDVPASHHGDGEELLAAVRAQGLEGLVAKRLDSTYQPGRRSSAWRKIKVRNEQEFVVGGWIEGEGSRRGRIGGLLVGVYEGTSLRYAGRVGSGLTEQDLAVLQEAVDGLATNECPFDPTPPGSVVRLARWTRPRIVVQVAFAEWTPEGRLRHPSYRGVRVDKAPAEVHRER